MRVLLIAPHLPKIGWLAYEVLPPLGLGYLAAVLEREGIEVKIFDNYLYKRPLKYIYNLVSDFKPQVVGITSTTATYLSCIEIAKVVKEFSSEILVVVGGPHPTLFPEQMLDTKEIDMVVRGEGEYTFRELVLNYKNRNLWKSIPGIVYREDGEITNTGRREPIKNLDELPFPARHLLPMEDYPQKVEFLNVLPVYSINTSRGCPYRCKYCSVRIIWGVSYRSFSPQKIVAELELLVRKYGAKGIYFREDNFTTNHKRVREICQRILEKKLNIEWVCESRVDHINREIINEMYRAGCRAIWFGPESGSQRVLDMIEKGITIEQIRKAFHLCKKLKIKAGASFMMGIPGEKIEEMFMTLELADEIDAYWCWFNYFLGIPGSPLYELIIKEGLYDQIDGSGFARVKTEEFDYRKAMDIRRKILVNYYFRSPKRVLRLLKEAIKTGTWRDYVIGGLKLTKIYRVFL